jgi:hypothetical protein
MAVFGIDIRAARIAPHPLIVESFGLTSLREIALGINALGGRFTGLGGKPLYSGNARRKILKS